MKDAFGYFVGLILMAVALVLFIAGPIALFFLGALLVLALPSLVALLMFGGLVLTIKDAIVGRR